MNLAFYGYLLFLQGIVATRGASPFVNVRNALLVTKEIANEGHKILRQDIQDIQASREKGIRHLQEPAVEGGEDADMVICEAWGNMNEAMFPFVFNCMTNLAAFFEGEDMDEQVLRDFCNESNETSCISDLNNLVTSAEENGSDNCTTQATDMGSMRTVCLQEEGIFCFTQFTELVGTGQEDMGGVPSSDVLCHPCYDSIMTLATASANETEAAQFNAMREVFSHTCVEDENGNICLDLITTTVAESDATDCSIDDDLLAGDTCSEGCRTYLSEMFSSLGCCSSPYISMDTLRGSETVMQYVTETCGLVVPPECETTETTPETDAPTDQAEAADGTSDATITAANKIFCTMTISVALWLTFATFI